MAYDERLTLQAADVLFGDYHELHSTAVRDAIAEISQLRAERDRLKEGARELITKLPRCTEGVDDLCGKPACWNWYDAEHYCDEHKPYKGLEEPWAEPLRVLSKMVEE